MWRHHTECARRSQSSGDDTGGKSPGGSFGPTKTVCPVTCHPHARFACLPALTVSYRHCVLEGVLAVSAPSRNVKRVLQSAAKQQSARRGGGGRPPVKAPRQRLASWRGWLLLIAVLGPMLVAAFWQWHGAAAEARWRQQELAQEQMPALPLAQALKLANEDPHLVAGRLVKFNGRYLPGYRVALERSARPGEAAGYELHQVLQPEAGMPALLIDRGWLPTDAAGGPAVPADDSNDNVLTLSGRIMLPADDFAAGVPVFTRGLWRVDSLDPRIWAARWQLNLQPWVVRLAPDAPGGFRRDWAPGIGETASPWRYRGYALLWLLAALVWIVGWRYFQRTHRAARLKHLL